jgi:hypothetical protein
VQDRGGGGGTTTVTADPARLTAFADEVTAGIARALAASDAYGTAVRTDRAAGPNDLGTTIQRRSPGVARTDLRRVERMGRDLARFGEPSAASPGFGATAFATDGASGHSAYYQPESESLINLGRIAAGVAPR